MTIKTKKLLLIILAIIFCLTAGCLGACVTYTALAQSDEQTQITSWKEAGYYKGVGASINVITANSFVEFKEDAVLDYSKMRDKGIGTDTDRLNQSSSGSGSIITEGEMLDDFWGNMLFYESTDTFLKYFENIITKNADFDFSDYKYKLLRVNRYKYCDERIYIPNYFNVLASEDIYSESYLLNLQALQNNQITFKQFFDKFGTHLVCDLYTGANFLSVYSLVSNDVDFNGVQGFASKEKDTDVVQPLLDAYNAKYKTAYNKTSIKSTLGVETLGGLNFEFNTLQDIAQKSSAWNSSISSPDGKQKRLDIIGFHKDGLVPLWETLPEEYSELATDMQKAFEQEKEQQKQLFNQKFSTVVYAMTGSGIAAEPYVITRPEQLFEIENKPYAYYKLGNDIDISCFPQWEPLCDKSNPFTGVFDGDGHTISGLTRTESLKLNDNRAYFGFIGYVAGGLNKQNFKPEIKNVNFTNVNVNITKQKCKNKDRTFMGVVCGGIEGGEIKDVNVESGVIKNSLKGKGVVFVGGIVGYATNEKFYGYEGLITRCVNKIEVVAGRYTAVAGGICGYSYYALIYSVENSGNVTAYGTKLGGSARAGGIIGEKYSYVDQASKDLEYNTGKTIAKKGWKSLFGIKCKTSDWCASVTKRKY